MLREAITGIPVRYRRNLLITLDGAGASHGLVNHITNLNASPWRSVQYSLGWDLGTRERTAINRVPAPAWGAVLDGDGHPRGLEEAGVVELTALLREHPDGDQLANWPQDLRIICRREKPHPGAQLSLFEAIDGWRYQLLATNTPHTTAQFLQARHRPHARVEDTIRTGKHTGLGHLPSTSIEINRAWCVAATIACDLLCCYGCCACTDHWPAPNPRPCATGCCTPPPVSCTANAHARSASPKPGPGQANSPPASSPRSPYPHQPEVDQQTPRSPPRKPTRTVEPGAHQRDSRASSLNRTLTTTSTSSTKINNPEPRVVPINPANDQG